MPLKILHVKENLISEFHDGTTWDRAYTDLQTALDEAEAHVNENRDNTAIVKVAQGTYLPSKSHSMPGMPRFYHFRLYNGVEIQGGYSGDTPEERNPELYPTIISGDFDKFKTYHVFYLPKKLELNSTAVLDGFIIEGGEAKGTVNLPSASFGGGFYASSGNGCTIRNCTIRRCSAKVGGGIYVSRGNAVLDDVLLDWTEEKIIDSNVEIITTANSPDSPGYSGSIPLFYACTIEENTAVLGGGAAFNDLETSEDGIFKDSIIHNNKADYGGGMWISLCSGRVTQTTNTEIIPERPDLTVKNNRAKVSGGGAWVAQSKGLTLAHSLFENNKAQQLGGGAIVSGGFADLSRTVFYDNRASIGGGCALISGSYNWTNTVFVDNKAIKAGGGLYSTAIKVVLDRAAFFRNILTGDFLVTRGGGTAFYSGKVEIYNTLFSANKADIAGGVYGFLADILVSFCTGIANEAKKNICSFIGVYSGSYHILNSVVRDNTPVKSQMGGQAIRFYENIGVNKNTKYIPRAPGSHYIKNDPEFNTSVEAPIPWVTIKINPSGVLSNVSPYKNKVEPALEHPKDIKNKERNSSTSIGAYE